MKAYLFIETGEVRTPKTGEWYYDNTRQIFQSRRDFQLVAAPILTPHEIEIPDGATLFQYQTNKGELYHFYREEGICSYGHFPIPRPKRKVKKWRWVYQDASTGEVCITSEYHKIGGGLGNNVHAKWCRQIPETEIEVEE